VKAQSGRESRPHHKLEQVNDHRGHSCRFESGPRRRVFSRLADVTPGGRPASRSTWRTTDGLSTPNRGRPNSRVTSRHFAIAGPLPSSGLGVQPFFQLPKMRTCNVCLTWPTRSGKFTSIFTYFPDTAEAFSARTRKCPADVILLDTQRIPGA
jgi:hypothetical protein